MNESHDQITSCRCGFIRNPVNGIETCPHCGKSRTARFTDEQYAAAREYWGNLTDADEQMFYAHYTTGQGKGAFAGVDENTSFEDYQVISMLQTEYEILHDC